MTHKFDRHSLPDWHEAPLSFSVSEDSLHPLTKNNNAVMAIAIRVVRINTSFLDNLCFLCLRRRAFIASNDCWPLYSQLTSCIIAQRRSILATIREIGRSPVFVRAHNRTIRRRAHRRVGLAHTNEAPPPYRSFLCQMKYRVRFSSICIKKSPSTQ